MTADLTFESPSTPSSTGPTSTGFVLGRNATLICLGDSITQAPEGYVTILRHLIAAAYPERNVRVLNAGIGGNRAPDMLARLERDVIGHQPSCVTISVGINDVWHAFRGWNPDREYPQGDGPNGVSLDVFEASVAQMVDTLREATDADIVLVTPTLIGEELENATNVRLKTYVEAVRRIATSRQTLLADAHADFVQTLLAGRSVNPAYTLTTDGVHLNPVGNYALALTVLTTLGFAGLASE